MKTLIVDRVTLFQEMIDVILSDIDIDHVFASTGKEALEHLKTGTFECICLALYLDDMDGCELAQQIRKIEKYRHTPIVLLTSNTTHELVSKAISSGITDIFSKENIHEIANFIARFTEVNSPIDGRVLYIEDQKSQRDYVSAIFKERKLEVDAFDNAEDAFQAFLKDHYNLVITDIVLEGEVSGILLTNKIRRLDGLKGDVPILAVTAFDDNSRRISLYHMGITDYVIKPIIKEELLARVRNLIKNQKAMEREVEFRNHYNSEEVIRRGLKLEALGKLTGGIAHDYNNMLGIISGYTDMLAEKLSDQPKLLSYVEQIARASDNGVKLTGKLLSFTRKHVATTDVININNTINEIEPMLEKLLTAGITINKKLEEDLWNVSIDTSDFENAILNLCINAKYAMNDKGVLTIMTANTKMGAATAEKYGLPGGEYVRLSIMDTGCGMDKEIVTRIFDPFFTTKGGSGTGLGLSQVYGFIQRVHGSVKVDSKPGKGTNFNFYFPRDEGSESAASKEVEDETETINKEKKEFNILVVDDEIALTELTAEILSNEGHHVVTALNANEALQAASEQTFDIMISDVIMPGMNGFELAEKIRKKYPGMKIFMISGYNEQMNSLEQEDQYYDQHLEKPLSRTQLIKIINSVAG